jgi:uncharacterized integral membrane protein
MLKLLLAVFAVFAVLFAAANTHVVILSWIFGPPVQARLITLLIMAFVAGASFILILRAVRKDHVKREIRRESIRAHRLEELDRI